jgi:hypothetical protein
MANYSAATAVHETLTASTVDQVTLTGQAVEVTVLNRTGTAEIYFTAGSADYPPATPSVGASNCYVMPAAIGSVTVQVPAADISVGSLLVYLISSGAESYSVEVL